MKRFAFLLSGLLMPAVASAAIMSVEILNNNVLPGDVVTVAINVTGGEPVNGVDLLLFVGDGGPNFGGVTDPATAPRIIAGDATVPGSIFGDNNSGNVYLNLDLGFGPEPLVAVVNTTTNVGTVPAEGLVALFTLDTSGAAPGDYVISLNYDNTFIGSQPLEALLPATLVVLPEPAAGLLLLAGLPMLRRRRA